MTGVGYHNPLTDFAKLHYSTERRVPGLILKRFITPQKRRVPVSTMVGGVGKINNISSRENEPFENTAFGVLAPAFLPKKIDLYS